MEKSISKKNYAFYSRAAKVRLFLQTHNSGLWWPSVPVIGAIGLIAMSFGSINLSYCFMTVALVAYAIEIPIMYLTSTFTGQQTLNELNIKASDIDKLNQYAEKYNLVERVTSRHNYIDYMTLNLYVTWLDSEDIRKGRDK